MSSGVYLIENMCNGKIYVGSSIHIERRFIEHRSSLNTGAHHNRHLQNAWNKDGGDAFRFRVLLYCDKAHLVTSEQGALDYFRDRDGTDSLYNLNFDVKIVSTTEWTPERKREMSKKLKGRVFSEEARKRMSLAKKGRPLSRKALVAASEFHRKNPASAETRKKISEVLTGRTVSAEIRAKISAANTGKKRSAECRARLSAAHIGHTMSEEGRASVAAANAKRVISDETRRKMSESQRRRRSRERQERV